MKTLYYVIGTLGYFGICILLACTVADISTMFNYISAVCISFICFIWPGMFYLSAVKKFPNPELDSKLWIFLAYFYIIVGIGNFALGMWAALQTSI